MEGLREFFMGLPLDVCILAGLVVVLTIDSLRTGIGRAAALALAAPLSWSIFSLISSGAFIKDVTQLTTPVGAAVTLSACLIACYILVRRLGVDYYEAGIGEPIQALIAALSTTIVLVVFWLMTPSLHELWNFSDRITSLFADAYRLWWVVGAYAALMFARG